jgi:papain fold toxin 1 (glutamine deamidase) of polymorphic toxin system
MAERIEAADAPPPPPPPPPPEDGPRDRGPEVTPELANAMAQEDRDRSGGSGTQEPSREQNRGWPEPGPPDLPEASDNARAGPAPADTAGDDLRGERELPRRDVSHGPETGSDATPRGSGGPDVNSELRNALSADDRTAGTDNPVTGRPDMAARYPADYVPTPGPLPRVDQPHENPQNWVAGINPDREAPWREANCGECARAVDSAWNGQPAVAAALARPEEREDVSRMTEWAGVDRPETASMSEIEQRLSNMGPGSSAVVGCDWNEGGGHWFNAVNDGGTIKAVDGQEGKTETWPPTVSGVGFDESFMFHSDAIFFTPDGKVAKK